MEIVPRRTEEVMWREEEDGNILLYHLDTERFIVLKGVTALIWKLSDGHNTLDVLLNTVHRVHPTEDKNASREDLCRLLETMHKKRLLEY